MQTLKKQKSRPAASKRSKVERLIDTALEMSREERDLIVKVLGVRSRVRGLSSIN